MLEATWFTYTILTIVWIFLVVISYHTKKAFFSGLSAVFSIFFGYMILNDLPTLAWWGLLNFITGIYMLYETLYKNMGGK